MFKHHSILLLMSTISYLVVFSNCSIIEIIEESDDDRIINKMVVTIIEKCDLGQQSIIVYSDNNNQPIFEALSKLKIPVTNLLMWGPKMIDAIENFYDVKNQALVLATDTHVENLYNINDIMFDWRCKENCTVIIAPKPHDNCDYVSSNLDFIGKMSIYNAYYVCISMGIPIVLTYDFYGDTRPSHWKRVKQHTARFNTWTLYFRTFQEDGICDKFLFERMNISHNHSVLLAINEKIFPWYLRLELKDGLYGSEIKESFFDIKELIDNLERLTKVKFTYYMTNTALTPTSYPGYVFKEVLADIDFQLSLLHENKFYRYSFVPVYWGHYGILSHNRGLRTPLEKIAHFYGIWTLSSLTVISVLTFIVIWYKMRRSIAFAAFDIIRLLINSGIAVPIDILPLKIFFCMIFLYFMVIHATFSGNLTKFLTIPQYHKNIDTVEELKNPQIQIVYCLLTICRTDDTLKSWGEKRVHVYDLNNCTEQVKANPNSVCVGLYQNLQEFVIRVEDGTDLYLSKKFASFFASYKYRKQFFLSDRFNKAFMYLNEIELSFQSYKTDYLLNKWFAKREAESEIRFRNITMKDLKFAFIFIIVGHSLSLVCFFIELIAGQKKKK